MNDAPKELPRVKPADIDASIIKVDFMTDGVLTICIATMRNGFKITGESACAHPDLYNKELGESIALAKAKEKIWPLLGYELREKLFKEEGTSFLERLQEEFQQLNKRTDKLHEFVSSKKALDLGIQQVEMLEEQLVAMQTYRGILVKRLRSLAA